MDINKCTFNKDSPEIKTQHLYVCKTCHFSDFETVCESCAKLCHSGHDLVDLHYVRGYCRCGQGTSACYCFCQHPLPNMHSIPPDENRQCDFLINGQNSHSMDISVCRSCGMAGNACMCIPCSRICHYNHNVSERSSSSAFCDCGDPSQPEFHRHCIISNPENNDPIPICTSLLFKHEIKQKKFFCNTCDREHMFPICTFCIRCCHENHDVEMVDDDTKFVCACGTRKIKCKCQILSKIEPAA